MALTSPVYFIFLSGVVLVYWLLPVRLRSVFLLVASGAFYATWNWRFLGLLGAITVANWAAAKRIQAPGANRIVPLTLGITANLCVLAGFKYYDFFVTGATKVLGVGFGAGYGATRLLLPVGLSFFIFHGISYLVDCYRDELTAEQSLISVALFLYFFPHVLAGPISKPRRLMPQFGKSQRRPRVDDLRQGAEWLLLGITKKVVGVGAIVAADAGIEWSAAGRPWPTQLSWVGLIFFVIGIRVLGVFELSSYTDLARGSAKLFGISLPANVRQPLTRSKDLGDYWRRHHSTLMQWLRDYIYRPVRGKNSLLRERLGILVTFVAAGFWHALSLEALAFGALTAGVILGQRSIERAWHHRYGRRQATWRSKLGRLIWVWVATSLISGLTLSGNSGRSIIGGILTLRSGLPVGVGSAVLVVFALLLMIALDRFEVREGFIIQPHSESVPPPGSRGRSTPTNDSKAQRAQVIRAIYIAGMIFLVIMWSGHAAPKSFTYYRF